jgi:dTDP-4-dehydrorhamnose 3,5-epimerase-like enzyme
MNSLDIKSYAFPSIVDNREQGVLRVFESEDVPFTIKRVFTIVNAFRGSQRGQHAHKKCNQLLCCVSGEVNLICDDGNTQIETLLTPSSEAVLVPNGIWAEQKYLKDGSVLIIFCDLPYDEGDYIRDYHKFLDWKKKQI